MFVVTFYPALKHRATDGGAASLFWHVSIELLRGVTVRVVIIGVETPGCVNPTIWQASPAFVARAFTPVAIGNPPNPENMRAFTPELSKVVRFVFPSFPSLKTFIHSSTITN